MSERVLIVGAGQVGRGLYRAFQSSGTKVLGLHARRPSAHATSSGPLPLSLSNANAVVVAVRDNQIDDVLASLINSLGSRGGLSTGSVVVHTSGSAEPGLLQQLPEYGLCGGTFHPLVPFANPDRASALLKHGWVGIDGDDQARATSRRLAGALGARTIEIPPGGKAAYHAAAVISSNFPIVLAALANDLLASLGVPQRSAQQAVHALMAAAVSNIEETSPADALTGPMVRGDVDAVVGHLAALRDHPDARGVYKRLALAALPLAAERGVEAATLAEMQRALLLR
ncbi:MAG: Rossmann-like and DUF2520 domain-containing protein [Gemmatimonadaceae bacterium]